WWSIRRAPAFSARASIDPRSYPRWPERCGMPDAVAQFLRYLEHERGASPHTLRGYAADLAELRAFLAREGVAELASADARAIRAWLAWLHDRKLAKSSIARKLAT